MPPSFQTGEAAHGVQDFSELFGLLGRQEQVVGRVESGHDGLGHVAQLQAGSSATRGGDGDRRSVAVQRADAARDAVDRLGLVAEAPSCLGDHRSETGRSGSERFRPVRDALVVGHRGDLEAGRPKIWRNVGVGEDRQRDVRDVCQIRWCETGTHQHVGAVEPTQGRRGGQ
jgi:hypothetical protein